MDGPLSLPPGGGLPDPGSTGPWRVSTRLGDLPDPGRARTLPFKLYLPDAPRPGGLIVFSHGLGGTREGGALWLRHWASHGFAALAVQHPGSDAGVLSRERRAAPSFLDPHGGRAGQSPAPGALGGGSALALRHALKAAMNPAELARRADDIRFVLGRLGHDPQLPGADLAIGLAGHSFGAVTVQLLAGEQRAGHPATPPDPRIRATLALSPSARQPDAPPGLAQRFAHLERPFMGLTGSRDDGMGLSDITVANRELPYRHAPAGLDGPDKYLLVFAGGNHLDFAGQASEAEAGLFTVRREPAVFRDNLLAASTAFWQAHLGLDARARRWLVTALPGRLRPTDRFEFK